ncbi:hypothetical protein E2C01_074498 [Portunus trituberculatus]|uniref:Uncharacterized protein n=1 Tax=Portunus trituberculatus TaxID=210409 RepID=A0A5B7I5T0_PORTR|nr:hypothetical protein [Portunus trituberculatus]
MTTTTITTTTTTTTTITTFSQTKQVRIAQNVIQLLETSRRTAGKETGRPLSNFAPSSPSLISFCNNKNHSSFPASCGLEPIQSGSIRTPGGTTLFSLRSRSLYDLIIWRSLAYLFFSLIRLINNI